MREKNSHIHTMKSRRANENFQNNDSDSEMLRNEYTMTNKLNRKKKFETKKFY